MWFYLVISSLDMTLMLFHFRPCSHQKHGDEVRHLSKKSNKLILAASAPKQILGRKATLI